MCSIVSAPSACTAWPATLPSRILAAFAERSIELCHQGIAVVAANTSIGGNSWYSILAPVCRF